MKARIGLGMLLATMLPISACTHRQTLDTSSGLDAYSAASQMTARRDAEVVARNGQTFRWRDVRFSPDSTFVLGARGSSLPTEQVYEVTTRSRGKGALEGAKIGAGLGALIGLIPGECFDGGQSWGEVCPRTPEGVAFFAVGVAGWGAIIGAIRGARNRVEISLPESRPASIKVRPTFSDGFGLAASIPVGR